MSGESRGEVERDRMGETGDRPREDALDRDVNEDIDRLLDAIERIADGLAGIAEAIHRMNDAHAHGARHTTEGA